MKIKKVALPILKQFVPHLPPEVEVDGISFVLSVDDGEEGSLWTVASYTPETAVSLPFINKVLWSVISFAINDKHHAADMSEAKKFQLIASPLKIVRLNGGGKLKMIYERRMKYEILIDDFSYIGMQPMYGSHETLPELMIQNIYRVSGDVEQFVN